MFLSEILSEISESLLNLNVALLGWKIQKQEFEKMPFSYNYF